MAWLIGAIAVYGVVVMAIGIAVLKFLFTGGRLPARDPAPGERGSYPRSLERVRLHGASGTRVLGSP